MGKVSLGGRGQKHVAGDHAVCPVCPARRAQKSGGGSRLSQQRVSARDGAWHRRDVDFVV